MSIWLIGALLAIMLLGAEQRNDRTETLEGAAASIQQGDFGAAEQELETLLKQAPDDAIALNLLGMVRTQQHKPKEAENLFHQAIQTGHKIAGPHINLAMLYGADRPFEAIAEAAQALQISPGNNQAASVLRQVAKKSAESDLQAGNKNEATEILAKARMVLPQAADLWYESGFIAYQCESYEDADRYLTEALKLEPSYPEAMYALARTYLARSLAKPAEDEMRRYLSQKPDDATAEYGLGYILIAEQRLDEAKAAFEKSLALQPNQTESVYQLGEIALQEGQNDSARDHFTKVLERDPRHGGALTELGVMAYRAAKYQEARADFERAIASAPKYQKAHYYYALALSRLGQKADAEREFALSRSLQKEHGGLHTLLADQP